MLISTAISVDRLLGLFLRLRYRQVVTIKRTQAVLLLCWIIAVSCGLVRVWSQMVSEIAVFVAGVAFLVTSVFRYVNIHLRLQRHQAHEVEDNPGEGRSNAGEDIGAGKDEAGATTGTRRARKEGAGVNGTGRGRVSAGQQKVHRDKIKRKSSTKDQTISENSFQNILGAIGFSGRLNLF